MSFFEVTFTISVLAAVGFDIHLRIEEHRRRQEMVCSFDRILNLSLEISETVTRESLGTNSFEFDTERSGPQRSDGSCVHGRNPYTAFCSFKPMPRCPRLALKPGANR